jgi:hypothetical protein
MLEAHPITNGIGSTPTSTERIAQCIEALLSCAQSCTSCADACLGETDPVPLRRCIRLCLDCADVCELTARVLSRRTETDWQRTRDVVAVCADFCRECSQECQDHAHHHEHCAICARACRACEEACRELIPALAA